MDFHSMKRKQLQALCKQHKIPANLSNLEMANRISELLKGKKDDTVIQRPIEGQDENLTETESADVTVNKKVKKVSFSPEHELIMFSKSPKINGRSRRNMVVSKSSSLSVVNVSCSDMNKENLGIPGRALRSRGLKSMEGNANEKGRKKPEKDKGITTNASAIEIFDNGKSKKEGDVDSSCEVMLLRGKMLDEGKNRSKKRGNDNGKHNEKALDNIDNEKLIEKIVDNPGRVTRSRVQKLSEVSAEEEHRGRKVAKRIGNAAQVIAENKENKAVGTSSGDAAEEKLANDLGERVKSKGKSLENKTVEEHNVSEPQIIRRSKRNMNRVADSEILFADKRKNDNGEGTSLRKKSKLMATNGSGEGNGREVNLGKGVSLKMEEPIKVEPRRSNRRKNVIEADGLKAETKNVPQVVTADESSKDEVKALQQTGVTRRSRRATLSVKLVENLDAETDEKKVLKPTGVTGRSRRKTSSVNLDSADETETRSVLRDSVPELGIDGEVSKDEKVLQLTGVTRRSRCKTSSVKIVSKDEKVHTHLALEKLETEIENSHVLGGSVPQLGIADEESKDEKKFLQPIGTGMSMSKTSRFKLIDEEITLENLEAEDLKTETRLVEKECSAVQQSTRRSRRIASQCKSPGEIGGDSIFHQKDKVVKRKSDVMKTNNDPSSVAETIKETSCKKAVPAASSGKVAKSGKQTCRSSDFKVLDASSHNDLEVGEHFLTKALPSASEGLGSTSNLGFGANTSGKGTIAVNGGSSDMKLINERIVVDSDTNAAPRNTEFKTGFTVFEYDQVSVSNIKGVEKDHSPLDIDVHELLKQNITGMDKNDPEAHVLSEIEDLDCNSKIDNQEIPEDKGISVEENLCSEQEGLAENTSSIKTDVDVAEVEADICLEPNSGVAGELKVIAAQANLDSDETGQDNLVLPEVSNDSRKEGSAEIGSSADSRVLGDQTDITTQAEADKCFQSSPNVVDRVGEAKINSFEENLGSDVPTKDNQVLLKCSKISEQEGLAETTSSADNPLSGDQTDIMTDVEVTEVEAEKCLESNPSVVGELKVIAAQENLDSDETEQDDLVLLEVPNDSGMEGSAETGSSADSRLLGDPTDIMTDLEVVQAEDDKCLQPSPNVVDHVRIVVGLSVGENLGLDEKTKDNQEGSNVGGIEGFADDGTDTRTDLEVTNAGDNHLESSPNGVDHEVKGIFVHENVDFDETKQAYISSPVSCCRVDMDHFEKSDNILDNNNVDTLSNAGAIESCERLIDEDDSMTEGNVDFDETKQAYISSPVSCHRVDMDHFEKSDNILDNNNVDALSNAGAVESFERLIDEDDSMTEGNEGSAKIAPQDKGHRVHVSSNSDDGKTVEGEFYLNRKCDKHGEFIVSNLFEAEGRRRSMPRDKEAISDEYSLKDFDEQGMFHGFPSARDHEVDLIFEGYEANTCKDEQSEKVDADESDCLESRASSKDEDLEFIISNLSNDNEAELDADNSNLLEISPSKSLGVSESQDQPKSPFADTSAVANIIQMPETCCNTDDANDTDCGEGKDDCSINKIWVEDLTDMKCQDTKETEEQSINFLEKQGKSVVGEKSSDVKTNQSWTETELHSLFGTIFDNDTPGLNDTSSSQTEAANLTHKTKSISENRDIMSMKEIEMEDERGECEKIQNNIVGFPTSLIEVSHAGLNVDREENQLATPIKKDETWSHGRGLERTVISINENVMTLSKSDEKDTLSDNSEGVSCEGLNEVESVEGMVNISSTVLTEAEYGASEEQLTENTIDCLKETNLKIEEDKEESCLYKAPGNDSKLAEISCINSADSLRSSVQIEGYQDMLTDTVLSQSISCKSRLYRKTEGHMTQIEEAVFEKSNHLAACSDDGNILRETFRGPLDAAGVDVSIFGTSPCQFSKLLEFDEVTKQGDSVSKDDDLSGANTWNAKDGNSRSSQDKCEDNLEGEHVKIDECVTASLVQFSIPQLQLEEAEDLNTHIHNISDASPAECTEILKESDVADTIKEYIDSESSLSMISENSSVSLPIDELARDDFQTTHENVAALCEKNEEVAEDEVAKQSVDYLDTESKELEEAASFVEPAPCVDLLAKGSTATKPLVETKGFDVKLDSQKQLFSTAKKNARTILIHGTPGKVPATADMKENVPMRKSSNVGDLTTVRPAKRRALQDVRWK